MSFINNANSGSQINLLCLIFRMLHEQPNKYTVSELQDYCAPETLFESKEASKRFRVNLNFWLESPHHLWALDENKKLYLDTPQTVTGSTPAEVAHQVRLRLMAINFENILELNDKGKAYDEYGASKAIRSFAYILTQDRFVVFKDELTPANIDASLANNFGAYTLNDSEKSYFIEFCQFLGLSESSGGVAYLDPTRLITSFLDTLFSAANVLPAAEFVRDLGLKVPILDNGKYNLMVREVIGAETDRPNSLSVSLSHALKRLYEAELLMFSNISDDINAVTLNYPNGKTEQISKIEYIGGSR